MGKLILPDGGEAGFDGEVGEISDGHHSFNELYDHRITLFIALCRYIENDLGDRGLCNKVWRSRHHSDGKRWAGWFILGIFHESGNQITYHLPENRWSECDFAEDLPQAPEYDGHTPEDVLDRLKSL